MQQIDDRGGEDTTHLQQFLRWVVRAGGVLGLLEIVLSFLFAMPLLGAVGVLSLGIVALAVWSQALLARGAVQRVVLIVCISFLVMALLIPLLLPLLLPVLLLVVLMAVSLALPYLSRQALGRLMIIAGVAGVVGVIIAQSVTIPEQPTLSPWIGSGLLILATAAVLALTLLLLWQFSSRLRTTLSLAQEANIALRAARAELELQVADRTAALHTALTDLQTRATAQADLLIALEQERAAVRELSVPVIPISATTLIIPLVGSLDASRIEQLQTRALRSLERSTVHTIILDITGVPVVDTQVAQGLLQVVQAAGLLGARVVLVGIRPEVAQALVGLGVDMTPIRTFSDLQSALDEVDGASTGYG
jgi:rsbT co-antagonist protein RsbR